MNYDEQVKIIYPPNTLSAKVINGEGGAVDRDSLTRAEAVISSMAKDYLVWVKDDLVKITSACRELKSNQDNPLNHIDKVFQIAHDMKGQGGAFNYNLMTILGDELCHFIEGKETVSNIDLEVISLYINTMHIVITNQMSGDGGAEGEKVLSGLAAVVGKIAA